MISIQNLSKSFGKKMVLNSINLEFEAGKVYGIVGENGAGKTTLFNCLAGLEPCDGEITSSHTNLKNYTGFLPTEAFFFKMMTGREYLKLMITARDMSNIDLDQKNIFDLPLNQYADTYSTGMKKKLALTAILIQKNDFYILDEPFNGVDIQSNIIITQIIHHLKKRNKTLLISSHIFSTLNDNCDEIYLLKEGIIVQKALKNDFHTLEESMKETLIGNRIERMFEEK